MTNSNTGSKTDSFSDTPTAERDEEAPSEAAARPAFQVQPGSVVILQTDNGPAAFLKAERIGKEYIHHYAVQLHPRDNGALGMVYLDPEDDIFDTVLAAQFDFGDALQGSALPEAGHAFKNAKGHFIKVDEDPQSQKMHGFIECTTGVVRRRQERGVASVYTQWCAVCTVDGEAVSMEEVLIKFKDEI